MKIKNTPLHVGLHVRVLVGKFDMRGKFDSVQFTYLFNYVNSFLYKFLVC